MSRDVLSLDDVTSGQMRDDDVTSRETRDDDVTSREMRDDDAICSTSNTPRQVSCSANDSLSQSSQPIETVSNSGRNDTEITPDDDCTEILAAALEQIDDIIAGNVIYFFI